MYSGVFKRLLPSDHARVRIHAFINLIKKKILYC